MRPYINGLREESVNTLQQIEYASSLLAQNAVTEALKEEEELFERERETRLHAEDNEAVRSIATACMTVILNLSGGQAALTSIKECLRDLPN